MSSLVSSVVIENDNNIVLDFSTKHDDDDTQDDEESDSPAPGSSRSDHSSTSLLSKVIKVTLSCMILMMNYCCQKCKTPTLKRKKSLASTDTLLSTLTDDHMSNSATPDQTPTR